MDLMQFALSIVENQGILALILLLMMWQNAKERSAILHKNCELIHFIMDCYSRHTNGDMPSNGSAQNGSEDSRIDDLPV